MLLIEAAISEAKREHNTTIFSELSPDFAFQAEASRHPSSSQTEEAMIQKAISFSCLMRSKV